MREKGATSHRTFHSLSQRRVLRHRMVQQQLQEEDERGKKTTTRMRMGFGEQSLHSRMGLTSCCCTFHSLLPLLLLMISFLSRRLRSSHPDGDHYLLIR